MTSLLPPPKRTEPLVTQDGKGTLRMMAFLEGLTFAQNEIADLAAMLLDSGVSASQIAGILKKIEDIVIASGLSASPAQIARLQKQIAAITAQQNTHASPSQIAKLQKKIHDLEVLQ